MWVIQNKYCTTWYHLHLSGTIIGEKKQYPCRVSVNSMHSYETKECHVFQCWCRSARYDVTCIQISYYMLLRKTWLQHGEAVDNWLLILWAPVRWCTRHLAWRLVLGMMVCSSANACIDCTYLDALSVASKATY